MSSEYSATIRIDKNGDRTLPVTQESRFESRRRRQSCRQKFYRSWSKGISPFHGKASLADLRRICRGDAGKLRAHVIDNIKIAVGPVVISEAEVGTDSLRVRGIHLNETSECQKPIEGIIGL
jgi:hypothetical protein